jgi:hypothetical protein
MKKTIIVEEYAKGDVIGIFSRVIDKALEGVGHGCMRGRKVLSRVTGNLFGFSGRHADMIETIKELGNEKYIPECGSFFNKEGGKPAELESDSVHAEIEKILKQFELIKSALIYSQNAYTQKMLPLRQILIIDKQAMKIAEATMVYLSNSGNVQFVKKFVKTAEMFERVCSLFVKYHKTGKQLFYEKTKQLLVNTSSALLSVCEVNSFNGSMDELCSI